VTSKNGTTLRTDVLTYTAQTYGSAFSKGLLASKTVASGTADQAVTSYTTMLPGSLPSRPPTLVRLIPMSLRL